MMSLIVRDTLLVVLFCWIALGMLIEASGYASERLEKKLAIGFGLVMLILIVCIFVLVWSLF